MPIYTPKRFVRRSSTGVSRISGTYSNTDESWWDIGARVRERDRYTCTHPGCNKYLGKTGGHVHHLRRLSRGAATAMSNLTLLCEEHHEEKHPHMTRRKS
jgi:5-methylcytosine-specific restriction endonuclease McrA